MDEKEVLENTTENVENEQPQEDTEADRAEELLSNKDEVPAELRGLSPEMQQEAMKELASQQQQEQESETEQEEETGVADTDSVKKTDEPAFKKPNQKIPYERFKEVLDKNNDLKAELENLKAQMAAAPKQQPAPQPQQAQPAPQQTAPSQQQGFSVTPEVARQIDDAIKQRALQLAGISPDELKNMEYMDEDDGRKSRYEHAKKMAESEVYYNIQQARVQQQLQYQRAVAYHNTMADNYNAFQNAEMAEPDFAAVRDYATNEYFNTLEEIDKPVIRDAYTRISHNTASPQDIAVIKRFFLDAKNSYHQKQKADVEAAQAKTAAKNIETKYKQQKAFPRAAQVAGSTASTGAPSTEALERMINELPWDEIPQEYKDLVMNSSTLG